MKRFCLLAAAIAFLEVGGPAHGDSIHFEVRHRLPKQSEIADGVPATAHIFGFLVTTDGDILNVGYIQIRLGSVSFYQHSFGDVQNANRPNPALEPFFPAIAADTPPSGANWSTCAESRSRCARRRSQAFCATAGMACASTNIWSTRRVMSCSATPAEWGWRGSSRSRRAA